MQLNPFPQFCALAGAALLLSGCGSDQSRAEKLLSDREVAATSDNLADALLQDQTELAIALIRSGVELSSKDAGGTPLIARAINGQHTRVLWQALESDQELSNGKTEQDAPLVLATRANEPWLVKELLDRGASADIELPEGGTLVAEALATGRTAIAQLLLEAGADMNSRCPDGERLVTIATRRGASWLVRDLIEKGADYQDDEGQTSSLAHVVAAAGRPELVSYLASKGANLAALNENGEKPIHVAVARATSEVIESFVREGVSLDAPDRSQNRPLHLAVMRRDPASVRELLRLGADPNLRGAQDKRPIDYALEMREFEFASLLIEHGSSMSGLLAPALLQDDNDIVNFLLANSASPNESQNLEEDCLLGIALRRGNSEAAIKLVRAGANPMAMTREGQTAFHVAMAQLDKPVIQEMLEHGADPDAPFSDSPTDEFLRLVASENISKWSLSNDQGFRPLMMAADSGDFELTKMLLDYGASTKVYTNKRHWYPISWAARRGDVPIMQILLGREPEEVTRWAKVDLSQQKAYVYEGEEEIFTTPVSTGKPGHRTRTGTFVITNRHRHWNSTLYGSSMPFFQRFSCGDFGFHEGYVPGYAASHGCIRVPRRNVRKLWNLLSLGDVVKIQP
ncbi:MAG: ankyrin repeat domain-containing protein [Verrucomicrobiota bacterium JB023]|nr:ankyrin repeat domain-containing protein [Verrucomicrobiota bacterium JB023]